jgi:hypothetical protein
MQVSVENRLASVFAGVKDSSVAIEAAFFGDLICRQEKVGGDGRAIAGNPCSIFSVQSWDQQNMRWCLRIQIVESHNVFVAHDDVSRDFAFNNLAEDAVGI